MSHFLQIAIGVIPAALLLLIAALITKTKLIRKLATLFLLLCVAGSSLVLHTTYRTEQAEVSKKESGYSIGMVYAFLASGNTEEAEEYLDRLADSSLYIDEYALCKARMAAFEGDYVASQLLYEKALAGDSLSAQQKEQVESEHQLILDCLADAGVDRALFEANGKVEGIDPAIVRDLISSANAARGRVSEVVGNAVTASAEDCSEELLEAVKVVADTEPVYNAFVNGGIVDKQAAAGLLDRLTQLCKAESALDRQPQIRLARLKLQLLCEDFAGIAKAVDEDADYNELLVVSELYMNKYINSGDFHKKFGTENKERDTTVYDMLKELYNDEYKDEDRYFRKQVKTVVDALGYKIKNPAIAQIEDMLDVDAKNALTEDRTKIFLQLSRLMQNRGNNVQANDYLSDALNTVGDCKDQLYTDAIYQVISIINEKDNTEKLKDVAQYVQQIVDHSTTLELIDRYKQINPDHGKVEGDNINPGNSGNQGGQNNQGSQGNQNSGTSSGGTSDNSVDFDTYFSDYVSQKRTSLNITSLDASKFPEIKMEVGVDSEIAYTADQLKALLSLKDCGAVIGDFKVEDITYEKINMILVCDTSGSMQGSAIANLKNAVSVFVNNKTEKEGIGLVTFSSNVNSAYGVDTSVAELNAAVDAIRATGGTNIYDAVLRAVSMHTKKDGELNIIILMSDGQDSYDYNSIQQNIITPCVQDGTIIYSMGLGESVDSGMLAAYANGTGGNYLYVSNSQTLMEFYEYLRNLLVNRYRVTFTAYDTFSTDREVKLTVKDDELSYDTQRYYLNRDEQDELTQSETIVFDNKLVSGLQTRLLYKSKKAQVINLLCENFSQSEQVSVQMKGKLTYDISCKYVDSTKYELVIPANMTVGSYDMIVTVNGHIAYFENEFVLGEEEQTTSFGPYVFTSSVKETSGNMIRLSGYVTMNDWLSFKGTVTLTGDLESGTSITMTDSTGAYVQYNASDSTGLANYLARKNISVSFGSLGTVTLYNDTDSSSTSDSYRTDKIPLRTAYVSGVLTLATPSLQIYPNRAVIDMEGFTTEFPYQDKLVKKVNGDSPFSFDVDTKGIFTGKSIDIDLTIDTTNDSKTYRNVNLGSMPMYYSPAAFKLSINTMKNEYEVKLMVKLAFLEADGLGLSMKWEGDFVPSEIRVYCDYNLNTKINGVPVTFGDFELAISDIKVETSPLDWTFEGKTKITVAKVSELLPKLCEYIGDPAVCSLRDTTLSFSLGQGHLQMSTKFFLFDKVEMGFVDIECGKITYNNVLLGMSNAKVKGMVGKAGVGIKWKTNNCKVDMGANAEVAITDRFIGTTVKGLCSVEVNWWIFEKGVDIYGEGLVGMYIDSEGNLTFTIRARSQDEKKHKGVSVTWSKANGLDVETKRF